MESVSGSDVGLCRVRDVGLGYRARQEFARAGGADGAVAQGHGTSLPGTAGHGIATSGVHMGIIVKFSEALPCVKSPVSRTAGTIYAVM